MSQPVSVINLKDRTAVVRPACFKHTIATAGTAYAMASAATRFRSAKLTGMKDFTTTNAAAIDIRVLSATGNITATILPEEQVIVSAPLGTTFNLADFFLDIRTNGDGVIVEYDMDPGESAHANIAN